MQTESLFTSTATPAPEPAPTLYLTLLYSLSGDVAHLYYVSLDWRRYRRVVGSGGGLTATARAHLSIESGPPPDQLTGPNDAPFAVITAGHFAARAGLPPWFPTSRARISQLMQLKPCLPWARAA